MAYNNAWANHRLLTACLALTSEEFTAKRTGFFPSLRATLNHILIIDQFYVDAMEDGTLDPAAWSNQEPCATVAALKQAQAAVDRRLLKFVERSTAPDCSASSPSIATSPSSTRMDRLLLHLFQHDIHHRGQAHSMLSGTSVSPPQLDEFFSVGEAPLRAEERVGVDGRDDLGRRQQLNPATVSFDLVDPPQILVDPRLPTRTVSLVLLDHLAR